MERHRLRVSRARPAEERRRVRRAGPGSPGSLRIGGRARPAPRRPAERAGVGGGNLMRWSSVLMRLSMLARALVTALVTACDAMPLSRVAAGGGSGKLTILGSAEEIFVLGMANAFEAETGVRTTYERLSTGE